MIDNQNSNKMAITGNSRNIEFNSNRETLLLEWKHCCSELSNVVVVVVPLVVIFPTLKMYFVQYTCL